MHHESFHHISLLIIYRFNISILLVYSVYSSCNNSLFETPFSSTIQHFSYCLGQNFNFVVVAPQKNLSVRKFLAIFLALAWTYTNYFLFLARSDFLGYFSQYEPLRLKIENSLEWIWIENQGFGGKFKFKIATQKSPTSNAIISTTITIQNLL